MAIAFFSNQVKKWNFQSNYLFRGSFVDDSQGIECSGVANERNTDGDDLDQKCLVIAYMEIGFGVCQ